MSTSAARIALVLAPLAAAAATLLLIVLTDQSSNVLLWGGAITLFSALPFAAPERYRRTAAWVCAAPVLAMTALSILSVGVYFLPALAALLIAGLARGTRE
ncbi:MULTISPECIES: hypothetical protein [unclassified Nocardiopsis]|uniref:hypothetical protein n=1 Tax=unclassified Nocardiopsis TaxID=2649073 RepID=UPI00135B4EBD|nr:MULTISPECIES: hypothetical protein [unclassified Nocardiopsis]